MNKQLFEYHPNTAYKFIPNLRTRIIHESGGYLLQTNSMGFRSDFEFEYKKNTKKRILVFGDSFTAGDGVSNKYRYTDVLQKLLPNTEIYNFGLPGSGTDQQYLLFKEYGIKFEYDLLIISVLVENVRRVNSHFRYFYDTDGNQKVYQKPYFEVIDNNLILKNVPVQSEPLEVDSLSETEKSKIDTGGRFIEIRKIVKKLGLQSFIQKISKYQPVPEYNSSRNKEWLLLKIILEKWVKESKKRVIIVPLPLYQHIEGSSSAKQYQKRFNGFGEQNEIPIHDPLEDLLKYTAEEKRNFRFKQDVHLTPNGHKAIANSLVKNDIIAHL